MELFIAVLFIIAVAGLATVLFLIHTAYWEVQGHVTPSLKVTDREKLDEWYEEFRARIEAAEEAEKMEELERMLRVTLERQEEARKKDELFCQAILFYQKREWDREQAYQAEYYASEDPETRIIEEAAVSLAAKYVEQQAAWAASDAWDAGAGVWGGERRPHPAAYYFMLRVTQ